VNAVVIGYRGATHKTLFQGAAAAALSAPPPRLRPRIGSSGVLVAETDEGFLRVAAGLARSAVQAQGCALDRLSEASVPAHIRRRIPWIVRRGDAGLAAWSLERSLAGTASGPVPHPALVAQCVEFLADLHLAGRGLAERVSCAANAAVVARHAPQRAEALMRLGGRLDLRLGDAPRGFAHGDFWTGNLLVRNGSLTGVVDWVAAGPGRLPLLDLVHLQVGVRREEAGHSLGRALVLYARARSEAESAALATYCARIGCSLRDLDLDALLAAYWLESLARDLTDPDRAVAPPDSSWLRENIDSVLELLGPRLGGGLSSADQPMSGTMRMPFTSGAGMPTQRDTE